MKWVWCTGNGTGLTKIIAHVHTAEHLDGEIVIHFTDELDEFVGDVGFLHPHTRAPNTMQISLPFNSTLPVTALETYDSTHPMQMHPHLTLIASLQ